MAKVTRWEEWERKRDRERAGPWGGCPVTSGATVLLPPPPGQHPMRSDAALHTGQQGAFQDPNLDSDQPDPFPVFNKPSY